MTEIHSGRANGDSYFTVEDLTRIKNNLEFIIRRHGVDLFDLVDKIDKEIEYIKSINVS